MDDATIRQILLESKTVAMVGLSGNWYRPSYFAAKYLIEHGFTVFPVNPNYDEILGQPEKPWLSCLCTEGLATLYFQCKTLMISAHALQTVCNILFLKKLRK